MKQSKSDPGIGSFSVRRDLLSADTTLPVVVQYAFGFHWSDQVAGLPKWAETARYDIEAKMDADALAALDKMEIPERLVKRREMCLQILTERFGLKFHHETRRMRVYDLVIAKGGPKLARADAQSTGSHSSMGRTKLTGTGLTLSEIALRLSDRVDRHIIDKTGLQGRYDVELNWSPDEGENLQAIDLQASLITAIREQLGLKLVPAKAPVDTVVIDSISKPTEN